MSDRSVERSSERRLDSIRAIGVSDSTRPEPQAPVLFSLQCPPLLLAAASVAWGFSTGYEHFALLMAVLVELPRLLRVRFEFSDTDLARVSDLTTVGLLLLVVYQFDVHRMYGVFAVLELLPVAFFPLVMTQVFARDSSISLSSLFLSVRRAHRKGMIEKPPRIDVRLIFVMFCLLAASAGEDRGQTLFVVTAGLLLWMLFCNRRSHIGTVRFALSLVVALGFSFGILSSVVWLRQALEPLVTQWVEEYVQDRGDPYRAHTALGYLGRLKGSSRIVLRVRGQPGTPIPLLREAVYRVFSNNVWIASGGDLNALKSDVEGVRWQLGPGARPMQSVYISRSISRGRALVAMPTGAFALDELPVESIQRNKLGTARIEQGPSIVRYRVQYAQKGETQPPDERDLELPSGEKAYLEALVASLELQQMTPRERIRRLGRFFSSEFEYTLRPQARRHENSPILEFLQKTRAGHCEYFASAAVLLLRASGIPARYATGYAVNEYSELENAYIARNSDSHSWALAYVDGHWVDVDTTPASWLVVETERLPWWKDLRDLVSWTRFKFAMWRLSVSESESRRDWVLALAAILVLLLLWRLRNSRISGTSGVITNSMPATPGLDSELFQIEETLAKLGAARRQHETATEWLNRLRLRHTPPTLDSLGADRDGCNNSGGEAELAKHALCGALHSATLDEILDLHLRLRFDPAGLEGSERARLAELACEWLERVGTLGYGRQKASKSTVEMI